MVAAIAKWRTRSGIRRTSVVDTLSVDVEAYTDLRSVGSGGEGGVAFVRFSVSANGGAAVVTDVAAPSLRFPNYSAQNSPLPGWSVGMAPIPAYGITIDCGVVASGTVTVTAAVHSVAGTVTPLPGSIVLYNDSDGTDRRPSTKQIFCSPTGDDGNDGSEGSPKLSLTHAVQACRANTSGSSSADADCGGAEVVMMPGEHLWAHGVNSFFLEDWHTTGDWWLTVTFQAGASITRQATYPQAYLTAMGYAGGVCRIRFVGAEWIDDGGVIFCRTVAHAWVDGGTSHSSHWSPSKRWSVRTREFDSSPITFDGPEQAASKRYASCVDRFGCTQGFHGWTDLHDFRVADFTGVALQATGDEDGNAGCNGIVEYQRYDDEIAGHCFFQGGANWTVSIPAAGQMRIDADAAQTTNIGAQLAEIVGDDYWGVQLSGFTAGANNTSTAGAAWQVLETGTNGSGFAYVIVANPSAVAGAAGSSARIDTARFESGSLQTYHALVHPDILQWNIDRTETMHSHVAVRDVKNAQAWFTGEHNLLRCVLVNVSDGGHGLVWYFNGTSLTDCLFLHCSTSGPWTFSSEETFERNNFVDCVVAQYSNFPNGGTNFVDHCHFITGSPIGTNATTGAWYAGATNTAPFHFTPSGGNLNTASSLLARPPDWRFLGATGDSRGCWQNVAEYNWLTNITVTPAAPAPAVFGTSGPTLSFTGLTLTPATPAACRFGTLGPLDRPEVGSDVFGAPEPLVIYGSVTLTPVAAPAAFGTRGPTITISSSPSGDPDSVRPPRRNTYLRAPRRRWGRFT